MIETISNPRQRWGDSWTQGVIDVVSNQKSPLYNKCGSGKPQKRQRRYP